MGPSSSPSSDKATSAAAAAERKRDGGVADIVDDGAHLGLRNRCPNNTTSNSNGTSSDTNAPRPPPPSSSPTLHRRQSLEDRYAHDYDDILGHPPPADPASEVIDSMKHKAAPFSTTTAATTAADPMSLPSPNPSLTPPVNPGSRPIAASLFDNYAESVTTVDQHFRYASLAAICTYPILVIASYRLTPSTNIERLHGPERNVALMAMVLQSVSCLSIMLPLLYRGRERAVSGVIIGALVVSSVASVTNGLMAFAPVPVMVDPVTGSRVHLLRWCEWTPLAFLMTFLTEGVDVPTCVKGRHMMKMAYANGLAQGLSTLCGLIFPFCSGLAWWLFFMILSCVLFLVMYVRLIDKIRDHRTKKMGTSVDEMELYNRSLLSLKLLGTCTFLWTVLVIIYFVSSVGPMLLVDIGWMKNSALPMVCETCMDVVAKVLYMYIIIDVHDAVFDQGARAERRLEELRQMMAVVWDNSSDVIGISVRSISGSVTTMLSPTYLKIYQRAGTGIDGHDESDHQSAKDGGNAIVFELDSAEFRHGRSEEEKEAEAAEEAEEAAAAAGALADDQDPAGRRRSSSMARRESFQEAQEVSPAVFDAAKKQADEVAKKKKKKVEPKLVYDIEFAAGGAKKLTDPKNKKRRAAYGSATGSADADRPNIQSEEFSSVAELVVKAWDLIAKEALLMQDLVLLRNSEQHIIRCEAKVTRLEDNALVIVIRDISERFRRFEAEKRVISETTARQKDAEANRFTRHEVKNGLLAAIGLCDSLRDTMLSEPRNQGSLVRQGSERDSATEQLGRLLDLSSVRAGESSNSSKTADLMTDLSRCLGELDKTLHEVLDTILAEAMARDVIHEVYEPKQEKVNISSILCGSNISVFSNLRLERFPLLTHPSPLPLFAFDPQLLKYIHRNAISNACKYGKKGGVVMTEVRFDEASAMLQMDVINLPGDHHDRILKMGEAASVAVFSPRMRLHTEFNNDGDYSATESHSSGDGAWIMHKCAKTLGGECSIKFEANRTVFSLRCPATTYESAIKMSSSVHPTNFKFPDNIWGIAIDDSKIQRKLLQRFLVLAGVKEERCIILGETSDELRGFDDFVVEHVETNPKDYFVLIADENLDVMEDDTKHVTISGSMCIENIRHRLMPDQERRMLALVRSANDSSRDIAIYNSRAHGFLPKAPIERQRVLEMLAPVWDKRYPPGCWDEDGSAGPNPTIDSEKLEIEDDSDLLVDMTELKEEVEALNEMCAGDIEVLADRWPIIWERLHALKGDLKSLPSNGRANAAVEMITQLRGPVLPQNFKGRWATIHALIANL